MVSQIMVMPHGDRVGGQFSFPNKSSQEVDLNKKCMNCKIKTNTFQLTLTPATDQGVTLFSHPQD